MEIKQTNMDSELLFNRSIDTITHEQINQLIDKEMEIVDRLIHERITWNMGMCMLDWKDRLTD